MGLGRRPGCVYPGGLRRSLNIHPVLVFVDFSMALWRSHSSGCACVSSGRGVTGSLRPAELVLLFACGRLVMGRAEHGQRLRHGLGTGANNRERAPWSGESLHQRGWSAAAVDRACLSAVDRPGDQRRGAASFPTRAASDRLLPPAPVGARLAREQNAVDGGRGTPTAPPPPNNITRSSTGAQGANAGSPPQPPPPSPLSNPAASLKTGAGLGKTRRRTPWASPPPAALGRPAPTR